MREPNVSSNAPTALVKAPRQTSLAKMVHQTRLARAVLLAFGLVLAASNVNSQLPPGETAAVADPASPPLAPASGESANNQPDPATTDAEVPARVTVVLQSLFTDMISTETATIAVGERGHIVKSTDQKTWTQLPVPTRSLLTNVYARGVNLWAVGHEEVILHSPDGGASWNRKNVNPEALGPLLDVLFLDEQRGFAIGAEGRMLSTTDAGETWLAGNITDLLPEVAPAIAAVTDDSALASDDIGVDETPPHLNAIARTDAGLMIVGETGSAFSSTDEGKNWKRLKFPYNGPLFGLVALDNQSLIAFGLNGNLFQTDDFGASWVKLETDTDAAILGGLAVTGGRAVFVGARGIVLTKAPDSNKLRTFVYGDGGVMTAVVQGADSAFIVAGENGISNFIPK